MSIRSSRCQENQHKNQCVADSYLTIFIHHRWLKERCYWSCYDRGPNVKSAISTNSAKSSSKLRFHRTHAIFLSTSVSNELNIFTDILSIVKSLPLFLISFKQFQYRRHQLWQEGNAVRFKSTEHFCCTEQRA